MVIVAAGRVESKADSPLFGFRFIAAMSEMGWKGDAAECVGGQSDYASVRAVRMDENYRQLREGWLAGDREREHALNLLFLAWMHWADPSFVTGMSDDPRAVELWHAVFAYFGAEGSSDAEFLYVAGLMAHLFPWALGDEKAWAAAAERMKARSLQIRPEGFTPESFQGRGDFGDYFAHQAGVAPTHR